MWPLVKRFFHNALTENDDASFCGVRTTGYFSIISMTIKYLCGPAAADQTQALGIAIAAIVAAIAAKHYVEQR